jgi:hypothetical protein
MNLTSVVETGAIRIFCSRTSKNSREAQFAAMAAPSDCRFSLVPLVAYWAKSSLFNPFVFLHQSRRFLRQVSSGSDV